LTLIKLDSLKLRSTQELYLLLLVLQTLEALEVSALVHNQIETLVVSSARSSSPRRHISRELDARTERFMSRNANRSLERESTSSLLASMIDAVVSSYPSRDIWFLRRNSSVRYHSRLGRWRRVPKKKGCKGFFCCSTKVVGAGKSKRKCHYTHVKCKKANGKKVRVSNTFKFTGIFNHLSTGKCGIQTRYTVRRNVGILTGVAVLCHGNKFIVSSASGSLKASINGKKWNKARAEKGLTVKKTHKNSYRVSTKKFSARIIFNKNLKNLVVQTKLKTKKFTGFVASKNWKRSRVGKKRSWFKRFVAFVKLSGKGSRKLRGKAAKACKRKTLKKSCRRAVKRFGSRRAARDYANRKRKN